MTIWSRLASFVYYGYILVLFVSATILILSLPSLGAPVRLFSSAVDGDTSLALVLRGNAYTEGSTVAVAVAGHTARTHTVTSMSTEAGVSYLTTVEKGGSAASGATTLRASDVFGTVVFSLPYAGVLLSALDSLFGVLVLIGAPLFMILLDLLRIAARIISRMLGVRTGRARVALAEGVGATHPTYDHHVVGSRTQTIVASVDGVYRNQQSVAHQERESRQTASRASVATSPERPLSSARFQKARQRGAFALQGYQIVLS